LTGEMEHDSVPSVEIGITDFGNISNVFNIDSTAIVKDVAGCRHNWILAEKQAIVNKLL